VQASEKRGELMSSFRKAMMGGVAACAVLIATPAFAEMQSFDIAAQSARTAIPEFGRQSGLQILASQSDVGNQKVPALKGEYEPREALAMLLAATNLRIASDDGRTVTLVQAPQGGSAAAGGAEVEALIVTAQKKEENIQDVPIAISAFSAKDLEAQKIEGGFDLLKAIPNVTFSKNNFTSFNFSIRGVGTKAISATTDPGVAVAFNSTSLIQNRLFEQEYFDIERVEVLRGPQGTLYGRNATSGVINVISSKADLGEFEGSIKGEVGNYQTKRLSGFFNAPLIEDVLAVRLAGAMTVRQGYDYNSITNTAINGRDLWSARLSIGFEPTERIRANFIWEHFSEDDDRSRTGKQLCHKDPGPTVIGSTNVIESGDFSDDFNLLRQALFSQGCSPGNLYDDAAFNTPNGLALPFVFAPLFLGGDCGPGCTALYNLGQLNGRNQTIVQMADPYGGLMQSRDLRTIASVRNPVYRAKADVFELNIDFDVTDALTLTSQTAYNKDEVYSFQDFNRFNTFPTFTDTALLSNGNSEWRDLAPGGVFCDPQIGCTDRIAGFDISQADGEQFSQELRLQSSFDGPVNFSVGANYTKFETEIDYYVMFNLITTLALMRPFYLPNNQEIDITTCAFSGNYDGITNIGDGPVPAGSANATCPYIDPNPVESINGEGHNYFRSRNPYKLDSMGYFGELYWNTTDAVKVTLGLRYNDDQKVFTPVPSQVLLGPGLLSGGTVSRGYPEKEPIVQEWGEWSGRLGVDWKPELSFTNQTLLYAFYSRGYKGGGANPPTPGFATEEETLEYYNANPRTPFQEFFYELQADLLFPILELTANEYGPTFDPEFVDAFEIGAKNTLLDGALTANITAFHYDYKDYQVSQIRDRTAVNENFDAKTWGLEFETVFAPSRNLQIVANLGYLDTEIADGETSIDIMNRTQDNPNFVVAKPWVQLPSNCVVPVGVAESFLAVDGYLIWSALCRGHGGFLGGAATFLTITDPLTGLPYDPDYYDGTNGTVNLNGGAGIRDELGGNELPNAPHWTANIGAQYTFDTDAWKLTFRGDAYWQSQSWARVYNSDPYDKLHGWYNLNLSAWLEFPEHNLKAEFYVKNVLDKTPITDAFLNSDDTALTTNVFVLDPRLVGLSIRKEF
jgi:iron complex outermembrane receptor protein